MIKVDKAQQYINTSIALLKCVDIPEKKDMWNYKEGSDTIESYLSSLRVVRKLILKAMNEVKK